MATECTQRKTAGRHDTCGPARRRVQVAGAGRVYQMTRKKLLPDEYRKSGLVTNQMDRLEASFFSFNNPKSSFVTIGRLQFNPGPYTWKRDGRLQGQRGLVRLM